MFGSGLVFVGLLLWFSLIALGAAAVLASRALANYTALLPSPDGLIQRQTFATTKLYDRTGKILLYELFDPRGGRRTRVRLDQIPVHVVQATLSAEDKDFYSNPGFDPRRILVAGFQYFQEKRVVSGASTITQQLVRNVLFEPEERTEQSLNRKVKEAMLAYQITQSFTKDQILEMYLNEIYYGNVSYGIQAASEAFFGKNTSELTLAEAALLAGLPQAPSYYNPLQNLKAAKERQRYVLTRMVEDGYITEPQADAAAEEELRFRNLDFTIRAPHFVFYVRDWLEQKFGRDRLYRGGFNVITTLDVGLQEQAEQIVADHLENIRSFNANNSALVAIDPRNGEILTMVGSVDYYDQDVSGQVNVATSERQPGSTLKPITYALAFMKGWTPSTIIMDTPLAIPDNNRIWRPQNFDDRFRGAVTARQALGQSLNIPAIKALQFVGVDNMIRLARQMGLTSFSEDKYYGLSVTIGGAEVRLVDLVGAYTVFAAGGFQHEVTPVLSITDQAGSLIETSHADEGHRILSPEISYLITNILSDNVARTPTYGPNSPLKLARSAAVKTGTTDDNRDSWTIGYTPELVAGVWIGNTNNEPMKGIFGVSGAGQVWHNFMEAALKDVPISEFARPVGVVELRVCLDSGCSRSTSEVFVRGTERQGSRFWDTVPFTTTESSPITMTMTAIASRTPSSTPEPTQAAGPAPRGTPTRATPAPRIATPATPEATQLPVSRGVVPNVIGLPEAQGKAAITAAGYRLGPYVNYQGHDQLPDNVLRQVEVGTVLSTSPGPGTQAVPGTVVNIAVRKD